MLLQVQAVDDEAEPQEQSDGHRQKRQSVQERSCPVPMMGRACMGLKPQQLDDQPKGLQHNQ